MHINVHLAMHAKTYGTLINTQCGIKEMVHRIFKSMVPRTNRKNIELDLLKRYNTLFAIRHLIDSGIDRRLSRPSVGFANISSDLGNLLTNWYITEDKKLNDEQELEENAGSLFVLQLIILLYYISIFIISIINVLFVIFL
jgi:hypothetical protein